MYQPDASIVNMDTQNIDVSNCNQVSGIKIIPPVAPIPIALDMSEDPMLGAYFVSEDITLTISGSLAMIHPIIENVDGVGTAIVGCVATTTTFEDGAYGEYILFYVDDNGEIVVNQEGVNTFNDFIGGFYYIGAFDAIIGNMPIHEAYTEIYDSFAKVVVGQSSRAHIYLKKDTWEELYKEELNKINQKSDVISNIELEDASGDINLKPNTYNRYTFSYDNEGLYVSLSKPSNHSIYNEYILELTCTTTPEGVYFYDYSWNEIFIKWANDNEPVFEAGFTYIISIVNGFGVYSSFSN